jgi:hypothetical protein
VIIGTLHRLRSQTHHRPKRIYEGLQPQQNIPTERIGPLVAATDNYGPEGLKFVNYYSSLYELVNESYNYFNNHKTADNKQICF